MRESHQEWYVSFANKDLEFLAADSVGFWPLFIVFPEVFADVIGYCFDTPINPDRKN